MKKVAPATLNKPQARLKIALKNSFESEHCVGKNASSRSIALRIHAVIASFPYPERYHTRTMNNALPRDDRIR